VRNELSALALLHGHISDALFIFRTSQTLRPSKPSSGKPAPTTFVPTNSTGLQSGPVGSRPLL